MRNAFRKEKGSNYKQELVFSERSVKRQRWLIILLAVVAALVDAYTLAILCVNGYTSAAFVTPVAIMLGADVALTILSFFISYRMRYAVKYRVAYVVADVARFAAVIIVNFIVVSQAMTFVAIAVQGLHLIISLFVCLTARSINSPKRNRRYFAEAWAVTTIMVVCAVALLNGYSIYETGYFGQHEKYPVRAVAYEEREDGTYVVTGILSGKGDSAVVPDSINGKKVTAIDAAVFADTSISKLTLQCEETLDFVNEGAFSGVNKELELKFDINLIDDYRLKFFEIAEQKNDYADVVALANSATPTGMTDNEVYITFNYSLESFVQAEGELLPTLVLNKGTVFDGAELTGIDASDIDDLKSRYEEGILYIINGFTNPDTGKDLSGVVVRDNIEGVNVSMSRIYKISLGDSNDELFSDESGFATSKYGEYTYCTEENVESLVDGMPARAGFELAWKVSYIVKNIIYISDELDDSAAVAGELELLSDDYATEVSLLPQWTLKSPEITGIVSNSDTLRWIYGDTLRMEAAATGPIDGGEITYKWIDSKNMPVETNTIEQATIDPSYSGTYTLYVKYEYPEITALISETYKTVEVTVDKKEIGFIFKIDGEENSLSHANLTYKGSEYVLSADYDSEAVVGDDSIAYKLSENTVKVAGDYAVSVLLEGKTAENYTLATGSGLLTLEIAPYVIPQIAMTWSADSFIYNSEEQAPVAECQGIGEDGTLSLVVSGRNKNVGTYTAYASLEGELAPNYEFESDEHSYSILPKAITVMWETASFEYNGAEQHPSIGTYNDIYETDAGYIREQTSYAFVNGDESDWISAGRQVVQAVLSENSNYCFEVMQSCEYNIARRTISATWSLNSFEYNGKEQRPYVSELDNVVEGETDALQGSLIYGDSGNINAGTSYSITVSLPEDSNYIFTDGVDSISCQYEITAKKLIVSVQDKEKIYDKLPFEDFTVCAEGLVEETDSLEEAVALAYGGDAVDAVNAGTYTVTVEATDSIKSDNYEIIVERAEATLIIKQKTVGILWSETVTFEYDGYEHGLSATLEGLVSGDDITPEIAGAQISAGMYVMSATLSEEGNYTFDIGLVATEEFEITRRALTVKAAELSKTYDGQTRAVEINDLIFEGLADTDTVTDIVAGITISGEGKTAVNAGNHTYDFDIAEYGDKYLNYNVTLDPTGSIDILKKEITEIVWDTLDSFVYNGRPQTRGVSSLVGVIPGEESLVKESLICSEGNINVGDYSASVTLPENSNYVFVSATESGYSIIQRSITIVWDDTALTYSASEQYPIAVAYNNIIEGEAAIVSGSVSYEKVTDCITAGTHSVEATLADVSNYCFETEQKQEFVIAKADLFLSLQDKRKTYDKATSGDFEVLIEGLVGGDAQESVINIVYQGEALTAVNAGTYGLTFTIEEREKYNNYEIHVLSDEAQLVIEKKTVTAIWSGYALEYDGTEQGLTITLDGLISGDVVEPSLSGAQVNAGSYTMTATLDAEGNYTFTTGLSTTKAYTITKRSLSVSATTVKREYNGQTHGLTVDDLSFSNLADTDVPSEIIESIAIDGEAANAVHAGSYGYTFNVNVEGVKYDNYQITFNRQGSLTISPITVTGVVWSDIDSFEYNGSEQLRQVVNLIGVLPIDAEDLISALQYNGASRNVVTDRTITVSLSADVTDYVLAPGINTSTFSVTPKKLTVTAKDVQKIYDGIPFNKSEAVIDGLVTSDDIDDVINIYLLQSCSAYSAKNVGEYEIVLKYEEKEGAANYNITFSGNAVLQITAKEVGIVWSDPSAFEYDGSEHGLTAVLDGLISGDVVEPSLSGAQVNAGSYTMTATLDAEGNYTFTTGLSATKNYTIAQRKLTVKATDIEKTYNGETYKFTTGDLVGERLAVTDTLVQVIGGITVSGAAVTATDVGSYGYSVLVDSYGSKYDNYDITVEQAGTLTIKEAQITEIVWNTTDTYVYDGEEHFRSVKSLAGVYEKDVSYVLSELAYSGRAKDVGSYTVSVQLSENVKNYIFVGDVDKTAKFSITKRGLTVVWSEKREFTVGETSNRPEVTLNGNIEKAETLIAYEYYIVNDGIPGERLESAPETAGDYAVKVVLLNENYEITDGDIICNYKIVEQASL